MDKAGTPSIFYLAFRKEQRYHNMALTVEASESQGDKSNAIISRNANRQNLSLTTKYEEPSYRSRSLVPARNGLRQLRQRQQELRRRQQKQQQPQNGDNPDDDASGSSRWDAVPGIRPKMPVRQVSVSE